LKARRRTLLFAVASCGFLVIFAGCGGGGFETAPVNGKITYKGKPLPTGTIIYMPEGDKPAATGEIKPDGSYILGTYASEDGAVLGKHAIKIYAVEEQGERLPEERSPTPGLILPNNYTSFETSGLTAEVKQGQNTFSFELKD
jgi:hypothetical protein